MATTKPHIEVGPNGLALFLAPDAEFSFLNVNGTTAQLTTVVRELQAALALRRPLASHRS
jgi:hypothetical protein